MNHDLANDLLNSLSMQIAVLDEAGTIVAVNDEWKRFARENGGDDAACYLGTNYLKVCEEAALHGAGDEAEAVRAGMCSLLHGGKDRFSIEYPCHSPTEQRWFIAHMTRFLHDGAGYVVTAHENITQRKLAEQALHEAEGTLRKVLESLPVGVWIMNHEGRIIHGNPASQLIWGGARYVEPERFAEYRGWWLDSGRPIAAEDWAAARAIRKGETSIDEEIRIEAFDGSSKIILNSAIPLRDAAGDISGAIIVNQDITARKSVEEQLRQANAAIDAANQQLKRVLEREQINARTDELTGLHNRRHFFEVSEQLFSVAQRYRTPLSMFMFDIDNFKQINDLYGHQVGDRILREVARIARECVRDADALARYGGEEFIVTLPNTHAGEAFSAAEHVRETVAARPLGDNRDVTVTISVGVGEMLADGDTLGHLIQRTDQALYAAKNAGRNCSRLFSPAA